MTQEEAFRPNLAFPSGSVLITTHMWIYWARIAVRQERRIKHARDLASTDHGRDLGGALEVEEAISCISAVRHCLTSLFNAWKEYLGLEEERDLKRSQFTQSPHSRDEEFARRLEELVLAPRRDAVHHEERSTSPVPHDFFDRNVGAVAQRYSLERAVKAVDMLFEILEDSIEQPTKSLRPWSDQFAKTLENLVAMRQEGIDF